MKKIISSVLILCLILTLSGCSYLSDILEDTSAFAPTEYETTSQEEVSSSQTVTESLTQESVTEQVSSEEEPLTFDITLSFVGDVMLACLKNQTTKGSFNEYAQKYEPAYFLKEVQSVFANDDFTTVNLENVHTDHELEESEKDHDPAYWFYSKTNNTKILTQGSVEGVSLANNHTYDYGYKGYKHTTAAVKEAGLNLGNFENIMYYEKQGFKIAVICYGLWRPNGVPVIKNLIKKAEKQSDYQILYFHGGKERIYTPEEWKVEACHDIVDAGADLVIGNHPHVLQPREIYKDTEIIYSLGNFCFGGNKKPGKNTVIYQMKLTVDKESLELRQENSEFIPCYVYDGKWNNYQPCLIKDKAEKARVIDFMNGKAKTPYLD